ncbi:MAG: hypothetical protein Q6362_005590 [Candidatus Wukongarchaeota archaeon]|nr:hypothetical protein [Candidatus Wukongarchaeota archaeon]
MTSDDKIRLDVRRKGMELLKISFDKESTKYRPLSHLPEKEIKEIFDRVIPNLLSLEEFVEILQSMGVKIDLKEGMLSISDRVGLAIALVKLGASLEETVKYLSWQEFEFFTANILEENDFLTQMRYRFTFNKRRYEIDVVGVRFNLVLLIDCKHYNLGGGKISALRKAAEKQFIRGEAFISSIKNHEDKIPISSNQKLCLVPLIVSWFHSLINEEVSVAVVPAFSFNSFINNLDKHLDELFFFEIFLPS